MLIIVHYTTTTSPSDGEESHYFNGGWIFANLTATSVKTDHQRIILACQEIEKKMIDVVKQAGKELRHVHRITFCNDPGFNADIGSKLYVYTHPVNCGWMYEKTIYPKTMIYKEK